MTQAFESTAPIKGIIPSYREVCRFADLKDVVGRAMWCSSCQQDVPAVAGGDGRGSLVCPRCKAPLRQAEPRHPHVADWDPAGLDADLRHAERLIRVGSSSRRICCEQRFGATLSSTSPAPTTIPEDVSRERKPSREISASAIGVWIAGVCLLLSGMAAVTMSLTARRGDLWTLGLVLAFAGQTVLILGLVVRLEWWGRKRETATARIEAPPHDSAKGSRNTPRRHDAEEALNQPHFDLATVQRQLDLIAAQLRRQ